jgi:hypothetical protein
MYYLKNLSLKMINAVIATQKYLFLFNKATVMIYLKVTLSLFFTRSVKWCYSRYERKWGTFLGLVKGTLSTLAWMDWENDGEY